MPPAKSRKVNPLIASPLKGAELFKRLVKSPLSEAARQLSDTFCLSLRWRGSDAASGLEIQKQLGAGNQRGRALTQTSRPASLTDKVLQ